MTPAVTLLTILSASGLLPFSEDVMQVKASGPAQVFALTREIRISNAAKLAKGWRRIGFCPRARAVGGDLVLSCDTDRLHVQSNGNVLTIHSLRGLPWAATDVPVPRLWFPPESVGLGGPCPGTTSAGKAECLLAAGRLDEARTQLTAALEGQHRDYAALRMADLAILSSQPIEAIEWLEKAGRSGDWGRLASVRQCELSGRCLSGPQRDALFDASGMPAPLRSELKLRELRMLRFEAPGRAIAKLFDAGGGAWPEGLCAPDGAALCLDVLQTALETNDVEARITALTLYASGPVSQSNSRRPTLAGAAADAATALGARQYAAAALAAATPDVPANALAAHLRRVIALYTAAGERARAAAVLAYALDTIGPQAKKWRVDIAPAAVKAARAAPDAYPFQETELATELATAALARAHLRQAP